MRQDDPDALMKESRATIVRHVRAMLGFKRAGAVVFDNGNLIRTQARDGGVADAFDIQIFTEAYLRPLFARAIGPFRWISLANDRDDIRKIDDYLLQTFPDNRILANWIALARQHVPFEGLPARIAWLGHGERTALALARQSHGARRRAVRSDRVHPRSSRCRRHGAPQHHDRADARRLRRHCRLAAARRHGDVLVAGRSGGDPFRRRRLFGLYDQRRRDRDCRWNQRGRAAL